MSQSSNLKNLISPQQLKQQEQRLPQHSDDTTQSPEQQAQCQKRQAVSNENIMSQPSNPCSSLKNLISPQQQQQQEQRLPQHHSDDVPTQSSERQESCQKRQTIPFANHPYHYWGMMIIISFVVVALVLQLEAASSLMSPSIDTTETIPGPNSRRHQESLNIVNKDLVGNDKDYDVEENGWEDEYYSEEEESGDENEDENFAYEYEEDVEYYEDEVVEGEIQYSEDDDFYVSESEELHFENVQNENNNNNSYNNKDGSERPSLLKNEVMIICGVDGTVYTLDAWTGQLRGMFASGGSLVSSASLNQISHKGGDIDANRMEERDEGEAEVISLIDHEETEDEEGSLSQHDIDKSPTSPTSSKLSTQQETSFYQQQEMIIPGLDGNLYSLDSGALDILPINVQEIIDSPKPTCQHHNRSRRHPSPPEFVHVEDQDQEDHEECGLLMGQRSTKIFAINPLLGTVQWMQSPSSNEGGFTKMQTSVHNKQRQGANFGAQTTNEKVKTVLLQREDHFVRHVNIDTGEEFWNVAIGKFLPLDLGTNFVQNKKSPILTSNSGGTQLKSNGNTNSPIRGYVPSLPHRSGITSSNNLSSNRQQLSEGPSLSPTETFFHSKPLPSIVLGSDQRTLVAVDATTGTHLWRRKIESHVESIHGVGTESSWLPVDIVDESDYANVNDSIPSLTPNSSSEHEHIGKTDDGNRLLEGDSSFSTESKAENPISQGLLPISANNLVTLPFKHSIDSKGEFSPYVQTQLGIHASTLHTSQISPTLSLSHQDHSRSCISGFCNLSSIGYSAKIGKQSSSFFVASTLQQPPGIQSELNQINTDLGVKSQLKIPALDEDDDDWHEEEEEEEDYDNTSGYEHGIFGVSDKNAHLTTKEFEEIYKRFASLNKIKESHTTKSGIFITWSHVVTLVCCLLFGVFSIRVVYRNKKRKWIRQGLLPRSEEDLTEEIARISAINLRTTPVEISIGHGPEIPKLELKGVNNLPNNAEERKTDFAIASPVHRSMSLPDLNNHTTKDDNSSGSSPRILQESVLSEDRETNGDIPPLSLTSNSNDKSSLERKESDDQLNIPRVESKQRSSSIEGVSHVEGFPLVQYSRYGLEFDEIEALGSGGFGTVFRCKNTLDGREYAVKKVHIKYLVESNGQLSKQFSHKLNKVLREVKILAVLDHPNIVRYYTAWLEVETKDNSKEDPHTGRIGNMTQEFSSSLLAGNDPSITGSDYPSSYSFIDRSQPSSPGQVKEYSALYTGNSALKDNPLGWNNFQNGIDLNDESSQASLSEQGNSFQKSKSASTLGSEEDLGFNWDRGSNAGASLTKKKKAESKSKGLSTIHDHSDSDSAESSLSSSSNSSDSDSDSKWSDNTESEMLDNTNTQTSTTKDRIQSEHSMNDSPRINTNEKSQKHILYIQMHLYSERTLYHYLKDRKDAEKESVNIPRALRMFSHIAQGVKHVHEKGLIHRDLKPRNCFLDDSDPELVKIGDFGLSRESGTSDDDAIEEKKMADNLGSDQEITTQIGTSSYASPEQMDGTFYTSSTDIFSLGIIFFELCYPMYTGMERFQVFKSIRNQEFPPTWHSSVATQHPGIHELIKSMLSGNPKERPTASDVANRVEAMLSKLTVTSLDQSNAQEGSTFLRIEAEDNVGVLARTLTLIKEATPHVKILQYGCKGGQESKVIMEFNVKITNDDVKEKSDDTNTSMSAILEVLNNVHEIKVVRICSE